MIKLYFTLIVNKLGNEQNIKPTQKKDEINRYLFLRRQS